MRKRAADRNPAYDCRIDNSTICDAVCGNRAAQQRIIKHYEPYIYSLSAKYLYDRDGNEYLYVDWDLQHELKSKLLGSLHCFRHCGGA